MTLKLYWIALCSTIFGLSLFRNRKTHTERSWRWIAGKSLCDCLLLALLAAVLPPLLVAYGCLTAFDIVSKYIQGRLWRTTVTVLVGLAIGAIAGWCLEFLLILGVPSVGAICDRFVELKNEKIRGWKYSKQAT